ncbi:MAG: pilus assembly protein PilM [Candidatus Eisenbacteria bacterium]
MFGRSVRIGIDWSGTSVKAVRVVLSGGRARVSHVAVGPAKGEARAWAVLRRAGLRPRGANLRASLPEGEIHIREIELPASPGADLSSTLPFEMRRHAPLPPGVDWALAHQITKRDEEGGRVRVLAAILPRAKAEEHLGALSRMRLRPKRITPAPIAALNHVLHDPAVRAEGSCLALLDVGETGSWLVIHQEGCPLFCRRLSTGGDRFTDELLDRCAADREEADEIKRGEIPLARARPEWREKPPTLIELVRDTANGLADETREQIDAYRRRHGPVRDLLLAGGGALLPGLDRVLGRRLGLGARVLDPFESLGLPPRWKAKERDLLGSQAARFLVAVGLTGWWEA